MDFQVINTTSLCVQNFPKLKVRKKSILPNTQDCSEDQVIKWWEMFCKWRSAKRVWVRVLLIVLRNDKQLLQLCSCLDECTLFLSFPTFLTYSRGSRECFRIIFSFIVLNGGNKIYKGHWGKEGSGFHSSLYVGSGFSDGQLIIIFHASISTQQPASFWKDLHA